MLIFAAAEFIPMPYKNYNIVACHLRRHGHTVTNHNKRVTTTRVYRIAGVAHEIVVTREDCRNVLKKIVRGVAIFEKNFQFF